jgi:uncharacterized phage protein (TIGR01671 family)
MREIKFRVWSILINNWVYPVLDVTNNFYYKDNENKIFEQFTGLQDKNGVDIYEGDIISSKSWNPQQYEIIFEEGEFCFVSLEKVEAPYTNAIHHCIYFEVIGNIHQS